MERIDWLERALCLLAKHYDCSEVRVTFGINTTLSVHHGWSGQKILGRGNSLADATEQAIRQLTDAELLLADSTWPS